VTGKEVFELGMARSLQYL